MLGHRSIRSGFVANTSRNSLLRFLRLQLAAGVYTARPGACFKALVRYKLEVERRGSACFGGRNRRTGRRILPGLGLRLRSTRGGSRSLAALVIAAVALTAVPSGTTASTPAEAEALRAGKGKNRALSATIRRTKFGVPHITAPNLESLAAGYAFAFAEDNICTIANEYVTVRAQRSRYFGPDEQWTVSATGLEYDNLVSDTYFQWVKDERLVERLVRQKPPLGPKRDVKRGVVGYVRGYNAYLRRTGVDNLPDPRCRGAEWVKPIRPIDVYRRVFQLGILVSSSLAIGDIVGAAPVGAAEAAAQQQRMEEMLSDPSALSALQPRVGSNAYGFGGEATRNGKGLLLGNPHFPWQGAERLYQAHLRVPGKIDVAGASLYGAPLIVIGHTRGLAWSHTVATAWRFTPFRLTLAPGDPHSYVVDGEVKPIERHQVRVMARSEDGGLEPRTGTIHTTEYGPVFTGLVGIPLPWGGNTAFALGDVNATNFRYINHFIDNDRAQSVREYDRIQRRYQGLPWVNSIAADSRGNAYYTMQGAIPYVDDAKAQACSVQPTTEALGLPILDGSRSECNWASSPAAVAPGTFPPGEVPTQFRRDYVHNGNDSHWLTNPEAPLTGFDRIIGIEDAERTTRTRLGLIQVAERLAGTDGLPGRKFNLRLLERVALSNRQYLGELWRDDLAGLCESAPGGFLLGSSGPVDVSGACGPLRGWNLRDDLDSAGAVLFRRFADNALANFTCAPTGLQGGTCPGSEALYSNPAFSSSDPVNTPGGGLNVAHPFVGRALADAVTDLEGAGIPLGSGLRGVQSETIGGSTIPIHGGPGQLGVFNVITAAWKPERGGYPDVNHGSSFITAIEFRRRGCPVRAGTFVTYGQSENPRSPHANDYTRAYSRKRWYRVPFCTAEVRRETIEIDRLRIPPPGNRR
jgi:acyl-homoserine-lactone acylase